MALSNWDTLAIDLATGESIQGGFVTPGGVYVAIYKHWVFIHDKTAWREGGRFVATTIMRIQKGSLHYHDVHIEAIRGPQDGVYMACWHRKWPNEGDPIYTGMVGCGLYAFDGEVPVGVRPESLEYLKAWVASEEELEEIREQVKWGSELRFNQGDDFFAGKLQIPTEGTKPGESHVPLLMRGSKEAEE